MEKKNFCLRNCDGDLNQRWFVQYKDCDTWKKTYISAKFTTKEARIQEAQRIIAKLQGKEKSPKYAYLDALRNALEQRVLGKRKKTKQSYTAKYNTFEGYCRLNHVATFDSMACDKFMIYLKEKRKLNNSTINDYVDFLKSLFVGCEFSVNPFLKVNPLNAYKVPARYFSSAQRAQLKAAIADKNPDLWAFVQFMFYTFIRPGELRLLKVGDVDFEINKIRVPANVSKNGKLQFVVLPSAFIPCAKAFLQDKEANEYLFSTKKDKCKPQGMRYMALAHQNILKELSYDVSQYKLYSWKHTGAVTCVKAGVGVKDLQIQLRHHSLDQVNSYLRQMGVDDLQDLAQKFPTI